MDMDTRAVEVLREDAAIGRRSRKPLVIGGSTLAVLVAALVGYLETRTPAIAQPLPEAVVAHIHTAHAVDPVEAVELAQVESRVRENERLHDQRGPVIEQAAQGVRVNTVKIDNAAAVGNHTATIVEMMYEQQNPGKRAPRRPTPDPLPATPSQ